MSDEEASTGSHSILGVSPKIARKVIKKISGRGLANLAKETRSPEKSVARQEELKIQSELLSGDLQKMRPLKGRTSRRFLRVPPRWKSTGDINLPVPREQASVVFTGIDARSKARLSGESTDVHPCLQNEGESPKTGSAQDEISTEKTSSPTARRRSLTYSNRLAGDLQFASVSLLHGLDSNPASPSSLKEMSVDILTPAKLECDSGINATDAGPLPTPTLWGRFGGNISSPDGKKDPFSSLSSPKSPSFLKEDNFVLRSSEDDPSPFQMEIPPPGALLMHARICSIMDSYSDFDEDFDFSALTRESNGSLTEPSTASSNTVPSDHPVLVSLLKCSKDLVLEAFFREESMDGISVEAAIFSTEIHRQFIVIYRGSDKLQAKPLKKRHAKQKDSEGAVSILHFDHPAPVHPSFRDSYFINRLEERVFGVLGKIASEDPFHDVVMTGYSFGAALATIGSMRFASLFPMMRISCHLYSSPRVGGKEFRNLVNSFPNLKVVRIENGSDPYVMMPEGSKWLHVGHTITLQQTGTSAADARTLKASAYKFDTNHLSSVGHPVRMSIVGGGTNKDGNGKRDHAIKSYVEVLDSFTRFGLPWVRCFVGEVGGVVTGKGKENRYVV